MEESTKTGTYNEFRKKYKYERELGSGSFGSVNLYIDNTGQQWAVKEINIVGISEYAKQRVEEEIKIMQKIKYNYVMSAHEVYRSTSMVYIVMEYAENGKSN